MLLRRSPHAGSATFGSVYELARAGAVDDPFGYRQEFLRLVDLAAQLVTPGQPVSGERRVR